MPTDIHHERMRWHTMGTRRMAARLQKITREEKLRNFIRMAGERNERGLLEAAYARARQLEYTHLVPAIEEPSPPPRETTSGRRFESHGIPYDAEDREEVTRDNLEEATKFDRTKKPKPKSDMRVIRFKKKRKK